MLIIRRLLMFIVYVEDGIIVAVHPNIKERIILLLNSTQKAYGIDDFRNITNGVNGIEERMHLVWDTMVEAGQISVTDYVCITSTEWCTFTVIL
ncbi:hypothetical protein Patl1_29364 [Pistacia atlantica]|uniref:Uncharacterized protein n=1 Tax=Pistacia atlantica TaxID=434234 RepID=A0ACC1AB41_9ROSI|nr:hypothetical protein Patl1_29364 [Pistacia atlantica]